MRFNPFKYIYTEDDILTFVTMLMDSTWVDSEQNGGDPFWQEAERLLYSSLIGYIWSEAPEDERNISTMLEMINAMEVREDDETFKNVVDLMFEELEKRKPSNFAVRQYKKFKLGAGGVL